MHLSASCGLLNAVFIATPSHFLFHPDSVQFFSFSYSNLKKNRQIDQILPQINLSNFKPGTASSRTVTTESPIMTSDSSPGHHIPSPAVTASHSTSISSFSR